MSSVYDEVLINRNLHPKYMKEIKNFSIEKVLVNASCGDEIKVRLLVKNDKVIDGGFTGKGCAISMVSADLMIESVINKNLNDVHKIYKSFEKMILGGVHDENNLGITEEEATKLGPATAMVQISRMPARINCAKLAWKIFD